MLSSILKKAKVDCIVIRNFSECRDPSFDYLLQSNIRNWAEGFLVLDKRGKFLLVSNLEFEEARQNAKGARVSCFETSSDLEKFLRAHCAKKRVGLNLSLYPYARVHSFKRTARPKKIRDVSEALEKARAIKSSEEIGKLRKACSISQKVLEKVPELFRKGMTEKQLQQVLVSEIFKQGAKLSFSPIVAWGKNASVPHHRPNDSKIGKGFLLVDLGAQYKGYKADVSRTFFVGKPSQREKDLYEEVRNALEESAKLCRPGIPASELWAISSKLLSQPLPHALGHGIGLEEHDFPEGIGEKSKWKLEKNMVLALEPALYLKGKFGIRLEDDVLVGKKSRCLTQAPKEIVRL
ncbi:MAG: Xaa-Pro peptidase family protein [Candidatus Diapherotrites archaeon]